MIHYHFACNDPHSHYFSVEAIFAEVAKDFTYVYLPAWRPGKYQLADFAKNVQRLTAYDGDYNPLAVKKVKKDCWQVQTKDVKTLKLQYKYFAFKIDAGSTYVDEYEWYINPINCAVFDPDRMDEQCEISLHFPEGFQVATSIERKSKHVFVAKDYYELVDTPFIAAQNIAHDRFELNGIQFHLWFDGECRPDFDRIKQDFKAFAQAQIRSMEEFPVFEYHFMYKLPSYPLRHGVEHGNSTMIAFGPGFKLMEDQTYQSFLGISSHELFHTWNVKAIRPVEMKPYRFNEENYSPLGYVAEGVTTYFGDLFLLRSGVFDFDTYTHQFNKLLNQHLHNYGRFNLSVADSSFDTWLDGYEPGIPGRKTSIYIKGGLVAFILHAYILRDTNLEYGLEDVMKKLYQNFAKQNQGYAEADYKQAIESIAERHYDDEFQALIWGTEPLEPYLEEVAGLIGCQLKFDASEKTWEHRFGFKLKTEPGKQIVAQIAPQSPAHQSGLSIEDELIAVNGIKIDNNLQSLFDYYHEDTLKLSVFRNNHLLDIHLHASEQRFFKYVKLEQKPQGTETEKQYFKAWSWQEM